MQHPFIFVWNIRMILIYINDINWWYHFPISTQLFIITIIVIHSFLTLPHQPPNLKKNTPGTMTQGRSLCACRLPGWSKKALCLRTWVDVLFGGLKIWEYHGISYKFIGESSVSLFKKKYHDWGYTLYTIFRETDVAPPFLFFFLRIWRSPEVSMFLMFFWLTEQWFVFWKCPASRMTPSRMSQDWNASSPNWSRRPRSAIKMISVQPVLRCSQRMEINLMLTCRVHVFLFLVRSSSDTWET